MTIMLSLILAFMLTIGGSPADVVNTSGCLEASYIQALVEYGNGIDERIEIEKREKNQDGNYEWKSYLPLHDSIGNVTALINDKGHLIERYNYSPYGEVTYFNSENAPEVDNIKIENGKIRISFNRPVDLNDIFIDFYITATHSQITGPKIIINMDRDIEFSPSQIPQNQSLTIKIDAMDELSGNSTQPIQLLLKDFIYQGESSLLVHDQGPPRVERIEYESSSNCLVLDFNETINPSSITNSVEIEYGGNIITGSIEITGDNRVKFTPSGNLSPNVDYLIRVKDIKDAAGKTIEVFSYNFELNQAESLLFNYSILAKNTHSLYGNNSLMHGRDYEPEIGLYYFRNRYYHPQLGRFLQQDPMGYEDSLNTYQAFNQNPVNFTDPMGQEVDLIYFDSVVYDGNITKSMRRNLALTTEGTINTGLSFSQWFAHMLKSVVTIGYADQPWTYTTINFTNEGDFFQINQDTRSAGGKIVGIVTDPIKGVSDWAANNILSLDPNINPKYQEQFHENAVRQTPGAIIVVYTTGKGARFAASKINSAIKSSPYFENTFALMDQAFEALNSYNTKIGGPGEWVIKNEYLGTGASYQYQNVPHHIGMTYRVPFKNPNPKGLNYLDFDDYIPEMNALVDYKQGIATTKKGLSQARRHAILSNQSGIKIIWRVPNRKQLLRGRAFLRRNKVNGIKIEVVE